MRRGFGDLKRSPKNERRVSSLALEIYSKVNSMKKSKKTTYKKLEILRNCKAPIETLPVYYI